MQYFSGLIPVIAEKRVLKEGSSLNPVVMAMSILKTIAGTGQLSEMYSIDFNEDIGIIGHSGRRQ